MRDAVAAANAVLTILSSRDWYAITASRPPGRRACSAAGIAMRANVRASEAGDEDIAYEKSLSRKLLADNATLQLEAEVKGDKETRQVLDRIEPFLLEIANMGEKPSREEVRSIRERVKKNEIVAALEVY